MIQEMTPYEIAEAQSRYNLWFEGLPLTVKSNIYNLLTNFQLDIFSKINQEFKTIEKGKERGNNES